MINKGFYNMENSKMKINLLDNGLHSLAKGIEGYYNYEAINDRYVLKDCILRIHHGIELCIKHVLFETNPLWIFEDDTRISKLVGAQAKAEREGKSLLQASAELDLKTISIIEAINRLKAIKPGLLPQQTMSDLTDYMQSFTEFRNLIQHHEVIISVPVIQAQIGSVVPLVIAIMQQCIKNVPKQLNTHWPDAMKTVKRLEHQYKMLASSSFEWLAAQKELSVKIELEIIHEIQGKRLKSYCVRLGGDLQSHEDWMVISSYGDSGAVLFGNLDGLRSGIKGADEKLRFSFKRGRLQFRNAPIFVRPFHATDIVLDIMICEPCWQPVNECSEDYSIEDYIDDYTKIWELEDQEAELLTYEGSPTIEGSATLPLSLPTKKSVNPKKVEFSAILDSDNLLVTRTPVYGGVFGWNYRLSLIATCKVVSI